MRLIDADNINFHCNYDGDCTGDIDDCKECGNYICDFRDIQEQPTAYDIDKVIEKLEKIEQHCLDISDWQGQSAICDTIEIVKQEAEQCNNGWIPCSEKLPELRKDVLVTIKYTGFMGMHGYWIKTGHMEAENDWWGDCAGGEVIAWQPLPEPYKERD